MEDKASLISNLDKIRTTELSKKRVKKNICLASDDVVDWCIQKIKDKNSVIFREGKNWYITVNNCIITINTSSYTIITAHKTKK
ncbi:MAG: DUF3781 domain-containing protein [Methanobrevibacter sp.]|nr:DUF3781 domain-containing protein [Candidatus Methanovirga basalitermitum]